MNEKEKLHVERIHKDCLESTQARWERYQKDLVSNKGSGTAFWIDNLRVLANTAYLLNDDIAAFRKNHIEAGKVLLELLERAQKGPVGDGSFTTILCYQYLPPLLAAGGFEVAKQIAQMLLGKEKDKDIHKYSLLAAQAIRDMVLEDYKNGANWAKAWQEYCKTFRKGFRPFALALEGLCLKDSEQFHSGLRDFLKGFKRLAASSNVFIGEEKYLSLWALGLANWAEHLGITVEIEHPYLPAELIIREKF